MATETGRPWALLHPDAGIDAGITWRLQIIHQNRASHVPGDGHRLAPGFLSIKTAAQACLQAFTIFDFGLVF